MPTWVINTHEDYDEVEATQLSVDKDGTLTAYQEGVVIAGWTSGFWYSFGIKEDSDGQEQPQGQERQG